MISTRRLDLVPATIPTLDPELARQLERAKNVNVAVREYGGRVVFLSSNPVFDGRRPHTPPLVPASM